MHKGDGHILVSKDEIILIVLGTLLQMLGAIYDTVSVPYLTVLGFLKQSSCRFQSAYGLDELLWDILFKKPGDNSFRNL